MLRKALLSVVAMIVGWAKARLRAVPTIKPCEGWWARFASPTLQDWPVDGGVSMSHQETNNKPSGSETDHGRTAARATETDAGNPTLLGWYKAKRTAPAALRRLRQCLFPAAAILPRLRIAQGQRVQGQRQGKTLQLCDPSSSGARLHAALLDCRGGARRRPAHDDERRRLPADAGSTRARHEAGGEIRKARRRHHPSSVPSGEGLSVMRRNQVAVVGAAETTELGVIPNVSQIQLHADAALNAIADAGLKLSDIDGFATAVETPQQVAHYLGITPTWVDGTSVGGC